MSVQAPIRIDRHALVARANAKRFAQCAVDETDEAVKAYLRHLAVSWTRIAEQKEFLDAMDDEFAKDRATK